METDTGKSPDNCVNPAPAELPDSALVIVASDIAQPNADSAAITDDGKRKHICGVCGKVSFLLLWENMLHADGNWFFFSKINFCSTSAESSECFILFIRHALLILANVTRKPPYTESFHSCFPFAPVQLRWLGWCVCDFDEQSCRNSFTLLRWRRIVGAILEKGPSAATFVIRSLRERRRWKFMKGCTQANDRMLPFVSNNSLRITHFRAFSIQNYEKFIGVLHSSLLVYFSFIARILV